MGAIDCAAIVADYLRRHGYDGLAGDECGCGLDGLMPCVDGFRECEPAYFWPRKGCPRAESEGQYCEWADECGDGCWRTERPAHGGGANGHG